MPISHLLLACLPFAAQVGGETELLHSFSGQMAFHNLGTSVAGAGDVNADGDDDFIVGESRWNNSTGAAYVYSGADASTLHSFSGAASAELFGWDAAGVGDMNGDGFEDIAVSAYLASPGGISQAGAVYVYSGATGGLLHLFPGFDVDVNLGQAISGAGDLNSDGVPDLLVSTTDHFFGVS
jgi:hypothetical protein